MKTTEDDLIKKFKGLAEKEIIGYLKRDAMKKYERLSYAFVRVHILLDYMNVIDKYAKELQSPGSKIIFKSEKNFRPSSQLYEYIILEIVSFYDLVETIRKKEKIALPTLPRYWPIIRDFRNQIIAHLDKKGKFRTVAEWINQYGKIDKIGIPNIIKDFEKIYLDCAKLLGDDIYAEVKLVE